MSRDEKQICLHCRFWYFFTKPASQDLWPMQPGECRRRAPKLVDWTEDSFPPMRGGSWCGEFEKRRDDKESENRKTFREALSELDPSDQALVKGFHDGF